jgi:hypothetical protein
MGVQRRPQSDNLSLECDVVAANLFEFYPHGGSFAHAASFHTVLSIPAAAINLAQPPHGSPVT